MRTGRWRGGRLCCGRRTRGCGRRTRRRRLSWSACGLTWPFCSGWCSGGRQGGRGPSRLRTAGTRGRAVTCAGAARAGRSGVRGRGRGGGITRTCPGWRWPGISGAAGTASPRAGPRSPACAAATWRVLAPRDGGAPARWRLRVFPGADTACFVMDATRPGAVLARHAGIDEKTGQLTPDDDDGEPRRLVTSSDFYAVYQSAGKKAGGLVNLYCWAHIRRYFVRAGDANPAQLGYWTAAWLELI